MTIDGIEITQEMIEEAAKNPDGWIYKIDWPFRQDQYVPPEAIVGCFKVDENGRITDHFQRNDDYTPVVLAKRKPRQYMIDALAPHLFDNWIVEIDPEFDDKFPEVPIEGQIGRWYVDKNGIYTGEFRPNRKYIGSIIT